MALGDPRVGDAPSDEVVPSKSVRLLIILAPPRCYTTLVCAMLGQHPQMYGVPETHLFTSQTMEEWWTKHRGTYRTDGLSRAVAQILFDRQTDHTISCARQWLRYTPQSTGDVVRVLAEKVSPRILTEKTPQVTERIEHMQRIVSQFPEVRFLHLLRHPFGHVLSRIERRLKVLRQVSPHIDMVEAAQRFEGADPQRLWHQCNSNILSFLETVHPDHQLRVRGEDLLADPDPHLRKIAIWLKLRSDPEAVDAMKHPERSPFACFGPPSARRGGDEKFFRGPAVRPSARRPESLDGPLPWREDQAGFAPEVRWLARRFGYK